ncbi:MAG: DEAD/DEAH box helicase [Dehalococcoidia bacterium]|nr:MAG: DEAD/DEAH box helicase [Dehalococcoidia bacterium]
MSVEQAVRALDNAPELEGGELRWFAIPPQPARSAAWPAGVDARLVEAFARRGVERPYTHQAQAMGLALEGRDQVIVTPTASGKTLCYTVPVLQAIVEDPSVRALYLFPTKALAQDQLHELHEIVREAGLDVRTHTYDGDTSPGARKAVRTAGHVVITNPDMLHSGILPHHTKWTRLFENLHYVVIDELHTYRGVFGSHVANVIRRLRRICRFYGSDPVFICCSATIANAAELASGLVGREVAVVDESGAPQGERIVGLFNPPVVDRELGIRRSLIHATTDIASVLQRERLQTIVFAGSRTQVELLTQYLRDLPGPPRTPDLPEPVRGYRSGYLPQERRAVEAGLRDGSVRTVVSTNALELGIDIGGLDAAVLAGYPGSVASTRQQMGRAGRRDTPSVTVLVAGSSPLDQYAVAHPDFLFGDAVEAARIAPDNPLIAAEHVKCAVFELPLEDDERALLGSATGIAINALEEQGMLHQTRGRTYWTSEAYPAAEISLRLGPEQNVVIVDQGPPAVVIGEVDRPSAMTLLHDEAIYTHDGRQYHVDRLDWEELKAYVRPVDVDYYTDAHVAVDLRVLDEDATVADSGYGQVAVTYLATLFKKIRLHTHENIGWGKIRLPQDDLHTEAFWQTLPDALVAQWSKDDAEQALMGLGQLLTGVAPLLLMCDRGDLRLSVQVRSPHTGMPTVFLWERVPGGVGFSEQLLRERERLLTMAHELVLGCPCSNGCPGCVGPAAPGDATKARVIEALGAARTRAVAV